MALSRREFLKWVSAGAGGVVLGGCETLPGAGATASAGAPAGAARVVVVGGGYGGATAAKYVKMWAPEIDVVLIERNAQFISCPLSNLVLAGNASLQQVTMGYGALSARGVRVVRDDAIGIDPEKREVRIARGATVPYDRLIVSPSVDYVFEDIPGW